MSWIPVALLVLAVAILVAAEWPRLGAQLGREGRDGRGRRRRKAQMRLLRGGAVDEEDPEEFAASVQRDLERLPTIEHRD